MFAPGDRARENPSFSLSVSPPRRSLAGDRPRSARCIEDSADHLIGFRRQAIAFESGGNDAVVVGPDRPKMVRIRVIGRIFAGKSANAPATPHIFLQEPPGSAFRFLPVSYPAPQAMPRVGGDGGNLLFLTHPAQRHSSLPPPSRSTALKLLLQRLGLLEQRLRPRLVAKHREDFGHAHFSVVNIALKFARSFGLFDLAAICIDDRVSRNPSSSRSRYPSRRRFCTPGSRRHPNRRSGLSSPGKLRRPGETPSSRVNITRPAVCFGENDQIQHGRVSRAKIGGDEEWHGNAPIRRSAARAKSCQAAHRGNHRAQWPGTLPGV